MIDLKAVLARAAAAKDALPPQATETSKPSPQVKEEKPEVSVPAFEAPPTWLIEACEVAEVATPDPLESKIIPTLDVYNSSMSDFDIFKPIINGNDPGPIPDEKPATFHIPSSPEVPVEEIVENAKFPNVPDESADPVGLDDNCAHICESCNEWWSHGPRNKCRHPDILKQGLCMACLNGAGKTENADPLAELIEDDRGRKTLSPAYQIKIRNDEREVCKNMDIEQISLHIQHVYQRELEMRARSSESRKMRAELIDFEAQDVPEAEREAFKQALLLGKKTKEKKPAKVKVTKAEQKTILLNKVVDDLKKSGVANAQLVAQYMLQIVGARDINDPEIYAKLRSKAEAFVND